jgi:hypothetical protein
VRRARRYLTGVGIAREDSDDELGLEDLPWEWLYEDEHTPTSDRAKQIAEEATEGVKSLKRKRRPGVENAVPLEGKIVGARMGSFECRIGDCVLLKAEGNNEAWVGLVCEFIDDEENGKAANFMWFSTEKEIRNKEKKRKDFMQVYRTQSSTNLVHAANVPRTNSISALPGMSTHWPQSTAKLQSCLLRHISPSIHREGYQEALRTTVKLSSADVVAILELQHTLVSSYGRRSTMERRKTSCVS